MAVRTLNCGCGFDKRPDCINADKFPKCAPDVLFDMERTPWPFRDASFDRILLKHVLEHVGADFPTFSRVMRELYRVTAPEGRIEIVVPHFRHDLWWSDPSHVRAFTPLTFQMMSRRQNDEWIAKRANCTMLAYVMDVDFEVESADLIYDPRWKRKIEQGKVSPTRMRELATQQWGVFVELQVTLRAVKLPE